MGIFDDIKAKGAAYRLTEEALYAEALREIESGQRRDGIWAKAMAESDMDQGKAGAKYIKLRVQSLKDEVTIFINEVQRAASKEQKRLIQAPQNEAPVRKIARDDGPAIKSWQDFFDTLKGLAVVVFVGLMVVGLLAKIGVIK